MSPSHLCGMGGFLLCIYDCLLVGELYESVGRLTTAFVIWNSLGEPHSLVYGIYQLVQTCGQTHPKASKGSMCGVNSLVKLQHVHVSLSVVPLTPSTCWLGLHASIGVVDAFREAQYVNLWRRHVFRRPMRRLVASIRFETPNASTCGVDTF